MSIRSRSFRVQMGAALTAAAITASIAGRAQVFIAVGSMTTPRTGHAATLLDDGRVLITGGHTDSFLASAEIYDPLRRSFSATGSMTSAREEHTSTLLTDGRVLVTGGVGPSTNAELYDPATGAFSVTGSMTVPRTQHIAILIEDGPMRGKVLVAGGDTGAHSTETAEIYDPSNGVFSPTGSMTVGRAVFTAAALNDGTGRILVAGGDLYYRISLSSAELYDPTSGTFSTTGSMATPRALLTSAPLDTGRVLVMGGSIDFTDPSAVTSSAEIYNARTGQWSPTGSMMLARDFHAAARLPDGRVLVSGGFNGDYVDDVEVFDPARGRFETVANLLTPRREHTLTALPNGRVLVVGGFNGGYLASAEFIPHASRRSGQ
jgi:hypothetical protein